MGKRSTPFLMPLKIDIKTITAKGKIKKDL
jgi:hypothetical protein